MHRPHWHIGGTQLIQCTTIRVSRVSRVVVRVRVGIGLVLMSGTTKHSKRSQRTAQDRKGPPERRQRTIKDLCHTADDS